MYDECLDIRAGWVSVRPSSAWSDMPNVVQLEAGSDPPIQQNGLVKGRGNQVSRTTGDKESAHFLKLPRLQTRT